MSIKQHRKIRRLKKEIKILKDNLQINLNRSVKKYLASQNIEGSKKQRHFTGLYDRFNRPIHDDDIVYYRPFFANDLTKGRVYFYRGQYKVGSSSLHLIHDRCEIVKNFSEGSKHKSPSSGIKR
ncbi:hypothetical protein SAMN05421503_1481 [Terribacillus aidingensis]|uniref:Uncharacterized protein n=1 Tax=Terribacillus aidingensis TaxID=586416 RepID=A0A285NQ94_9BACI|nr:hypothetical protein [Terribacillus aidingensis]SNZ10026.1 hypothetical protein SAMN05421503_1481 [Terribacillus aidingensis]